MRIFYTVQCNVDKTDIAQAGITEPRLKKPGRVCHVFVSYHRHPSYNDDVPAQVKEATETSCITHNDSRRDVNDPRLDISRLKPE